MRALALVFALIATPAAAQGFAGLGTQAEGFAEVTPAKPIAFPADHGAHPDYRIEWWYLTANLTGEDGTPYGIQFTLFRQASAPPPQREGWASQQFWLGHAALTTPERHLYAEKAARGGTGQAGVETRPFAAWIDDWSMAGDDPSDVRLRVEAEAFAYDLALAADGPFVKQGVEGYSVKSDRGQASYYYSQPYYAASGTLTVGGEAIPVTGTAWMDREWSTQPLAPDQSGWDWFSLNLGPRTKLMLFRLRQDDGSHYLSGNWIEGARSTRLEGDEIEIEPLGTAQVGAREVPVRWHVRLPGRGVDVAVEALNEQAWNGTSIGYWEGPVTTSGTHDAVGYLEMTGY